MSSQTARRPSWECAGPASLMLHPAQTLPVMASRGPCLFVEKISCPSREPPI